MTHETSGWLRSHFDGSSSGASFIFFFRFSPLCNKHTEGSTGTSTTATTTEEALALVKVSEGETCSSVRSSLLTSCTTQEGVKVAASRVSSVPSVGFSISASCSHIAGSGSGSGCSHTGNSSTNNITAGMPHTAPRRMVTTAAGLNDEWRSNNLLCVESSRYPSTSVATSSSARSKCITDMESSFGSSIPPSTLGAGTTSSHPSVMTQVFEEKQKISLSRERKAARVLGIVMGKLMNNLHSRKQ